VLDVLLIKCATADALVFVESSNTQGGGGSGASSVEARKPVVSAVTSGKSTTSAAAVIASALEATPQAQGPKTWEGLIAHIRQTRPLLASMLEHTHCGPMGELLEISVRPEESYYREQLTSKVYSEQLVTLGKEYLGHHVRVKVEIKESGESLAEKRTREHDARETAAKNAVNNHPIITEAKALFGGELGPIELVHKE
jgi:hypothetical protein